MYITYIRYSIDGSLTKLTGERSELSQFNIIHISNIGFGSEGKMYRKQWISRITRIWQFRDRTKGVSDWEN